MTEANPPAQPEELCRRILLLVAEPHRRSEPPYHDEIAEELNEAEDAIRDQLRILEHRGFVFLQTVLNTLIPNITPKGLLEVEKLTHTAPQPDSPPSSETSSEPQEFQPNKDYSVVIWRSKKYFLSPRQAKCVRLLQEAHTDGTHWLSGPDILRKIEPSRKGNMGIRMSDIFKDSSAWNDGLVLHMLDTLMKRKRIPKRRRRGSSSSLKNASAVNRKSD